MEKNNKSKNNWQRRWLSSIDSNKKWYEKKIIIGTSSILGFTVLSTAIVVPIVLTNSEIIGTLPAPIIPMVQDAIKSLNAVDNKQTRLTLWNGYISSLTTPTNNSTILEKIVRSDTFIDEFITFLSSDIFVDNTVSIPSYGSVTQENLDLIKSTISTPESKASFKDIALSTYSNLFNFSSTSASTPMFTIKNNTSGDIFNFSLFMPLIGLDLIYNANETVSIKIPALHDVTNENNVRLNVTKFSTLNPAINVSTNFYFKPNSILQIPKTITTNFNTFIYLASQDEQSKRTNIINLLTKIQKSILTDPTGNIGLTYWNSFALNYAVSNTAFLKKDLQKPIDQSAFSKFLAANAFSGNTALTTLKLDRLRILATSSVATHFMQSTTPFAATTYYTKTLFSTNSAFLADPDNFSFELTISKFNFEFSVNNLFLGSNAISITPKLELSGNLANKTYDLDTNRYHYANYLIPKGEYDVSSIINMSRDVSTTTGGLYGFFNSLINNPQSEITKTTNGLVELNNKPIANQIEFWNTFVSNPTNKHLLLAEIKKPNVLYDFINSNLYWDNPIGVSTTTFPRIDQNTLKSSIQSAANFLIDGSVDLSVSANPVISLGQISYGSAATDKFSSVKIYFGNENNSMGNFNATSTSNFANISFLQTLGETNHINKNSVFAAASKRFSIVFETETDAFVFYFGQGKSTNNGTVSQVNKSVIIPQTILTPPTHFVEAVQYLGLLSNS
ncbi:MAG: hypothetical protein RSC65_02765 [Malacoplasma sp.]